MNTQITASEIRSTGTRNLSRADQGGYALLIVMFMVALVIIAAAEVVPDMLTQGRRQKETELIWRGKQYDRGIKLYYKKLGKYPQSLNDLFQEQPGNLHFMRKPYKDPMNPAKDGSWRLIYVGNGGILINSLMFTSLADMAQKLKPPNSNNTSGTPGGTPLGGGFGSGPGGGLGGQSGRGGLGGGGFGSYNGPNNAQQQNQGQNQVGDLFGDQNGQQGAPGTQGATGGNSQTSGSNSSNSDDSGNNEVFGGNIIGVASKINKKSIKVFQLGKTYKTWEFIWNSQMEQANALNAGMNSGGLGSSPGSGLGGTTPPGQQGNQNPNGNQNQNPNQNPAPPPANNNGGGDPLGGGGGGN
jgi:hypothetical protein